MKVYVELDGAPCCVAVAADDTPVSLCQRVCVELGLDEATLPGWDLRCENEDVDDVQALSDGDVLQVVMKPGWLAKQRLLAAGRCLSASGSLFSAIEEESLAVIRDYVDAESWLDFSIDIAVGGNGFTPLAAAVRKKSHDAVRAILQVTSDPYAQRHRTRTWEGSRRFTPLHYAASEDDVDMLKLLLAHTMTPDVTDGRYSTPLAVACVHGSLGCAEYLLSVGADANAGLHAPGTPAQAWQLAPLSCAVRERAVGCAAALIRAHDNGVVTLDIGKRQGRGIKSPLFEAADVGSVALVHLLLTSEFTFVGVASTAEVVAAVSGPLAASTATTAVSASPAPGPDGDDAAAPGAASHVDPVSMGRADATGCPTSEAAAGDPAVTATTPTLAPAQTLPRADPNFQDAFKRTPLHVALDHSHVDVAEVLVARPDVRRATIDAYERTPLHLAAYRGLPRVVEMLLADPAVLDLVDEADRNGRTAVANACQACHAGIVEMLIAAGADVRHPDKYGRTPLRTAADEGQRGLGCVRALLAAGAEPSVVDCMGCTAMSCAAGHGSVDLCRLLLLYGADVNVSTPVPSQQDIHAAAAARTRAAASLARESPYHRASHDDTGALAVPPLAKAAGAGAADVVALLLENGAAVDAVGGEDRCTPLHLAARAGSVPIVKMLLAHKAVVGTLDGHKGTPLRAAAKAGKLDVVELLLDRGADPNHPPTESGPCPAVVPHPHRDLPPTALVCALQNRHFAVVKALLAAGADANGGGAPLCIAARTAPLEIIELLLACRADPEGTDYNGLAPIMVARRCGRREVEHLLTAHMARSKGGA